MPGSSPRLWWSAAAYRSRLGNAVESIRKTFSSSGLRTSTKAELERLLSESGSKTSITNILGCVTVKDLRSCRAWRSEIESGGWGSQIWSSRSLSDSCCLGGFLFCSSSSSYSLESGRFFSQHRNFSGSIVHRAKGRRSEDQSQGKTGFRSQVKGKKGVVLTRKANTSPGELSSTKRLKSEHSSRVKTSRRVLSPIKHLKLSHTRKLKASSAANSSSKRLESEKTSNAETSASAHSSSKHLRSEHRRGNSRSISAPGVARKARLVSSGRSLRKAGSTRDKWRLFKESKFKDGPGSGGLKFKRRKKRIKLRPGDPMYKRGLGSEAQEIINETVNAGQHPSQEKSFSANARFRKIQPSRELLAHIEENFLGRRRLTEWRRGGYDPKRTAPLDDLPHIKEKTNPIQETVFKRKLTFVAAAKQSPSLPPLQYPEVAFAGRSNVGKSSLINALTRQWGVARTSPKPGLTQSINFFTLGSQLCLVDLPGYGFAYAKEGLKEGWEELVKEYVQTRPNLKRVCLLVDAKWGLKPRDEELIHLMESSGTRYQVVLTKTDVLPPLDLARRVTQILEVVEDGKWLVLPLMMVSSKTGAGLQNFRASLAKLSLSQARVLEEAHL